MLLAQDALTSFSGGSSATPLDCILTSDPKNRSIQSIILRIFFPIIIMCFVIFLLYVVLTYRARKRSKARKFKQYSIIAIIVALFFAYENVTQDIMRIMNCVEVDRRPDTSTYEAKHDHFVNAIGHYWGEDTLHKCYQGEHLGLVVFLGAPGMILFVIGIPAFIFCFLVYKKYKAKLMEQKFLNTYGFLYQNYLHQYVYWEVVIMVRKALINAIVVFAYPLGANLQGVLALGILVVALIIQLLACPFKYSTLNTLEGTSLVVSIFTFYSGIIYNDPNTSMTARGLFSAMLLVLNVCLVGLFVWRVWKSLDLVVTARLRNLRQAVPDGVYARFTKLAAVYAAMAREKTRGKASSMMVRMKRKTERRIEESDVTKAVS